VTYQPAPRRQAPLPDTVDEPPVDMGETGRDLYAATPALARLDPANGFSWAKYLAALSELLDVIAVMVRDDADGNEGWTALASPTRCPGPFLPVLAQWAGVRRRDALTEDELRDLIGPNAPGLWRGTKAAMIAAVRRFLPEGTADSALFFQERADGDAYKLRVFTYVYIDHDPDQVRKALEAEKPAGLQLIYEVREGQSYAQVRDDCPNYAALKDTYANYQDLRTSMPGRCCEWVPPEIPEPPDESGWKIDSLDPPRGTYPADLPFEMTLHGAFPFMESPTEPADAVIVRLFHPETGWDFNGLRTNSTAPRDTLFTDFVATPGINDTPLDGWVVQVRRFPGFDVLAEVPMEWGEPEPEPPPAWTIDSVTPSQLPRVGTQQVVLRGTFPPAGGTTPGTRLYARMWRDAPDRTTQSSGVPFSNTELTYELTVQVYAPAATWIDVETATIGVVSEVAAGTAQPMGDSEVSLIWRSLEEETDEPRGA
jgi:Phage tail protein (Tail_P2_I)